MARDCQHPDARWLTALFPPEGHVSREQLFHVMLRQGDDPRALFLAWTVSWGKANSQTRDNDFLQRSAEMGYASAQSEWSSFQVDARVALEFAELAVAHGDRSGMYELGKRLLRGCCPHAREGEGAGVAERGCRFGGPRAQEMYVRDAFRPDEWQWYHGMARAAARQNEYLGWEFCGCVVARVPFFEIGEQGRILHTVAPVIRAHRHEPHVGRVYARELQRVLELHDAMLMRARHAIDCWSMAARRCGVVKDMRVMIAKKAWEEAWQWGEK